MIEAAVFLCDLTGNMARPWAEAGIECWCVDVQHSIRRDRQERVGAGVINFVWGDVRSWRPPSGRRWVFGAAFTPCTHQAVSGARDFAKKGAYMLRDGLEMFEAGRQVLAWSGAPYCCENPVGVLSSIPHIGKPDHYFDPFEFSDYCPEDWYTKKTCLWVGNGFIMPTPAYDRARYERGRIAREHYRKTGERLPGLSDYPDDRIHKASPDDDRENARSATPMGFSMACFEANAPGHLYGLRRRAS